MEDSLLIRKSYYCCRKMTCVSHKDRGIPVLHHAECFITTLAAAAAVLLSSCCSETQFWTTLSNSYSIHTDILPCGFSGVFVLHLFTHCVFSHRISNDVGNLFYSEHVLILKKVLNHILQGQRKTIDEKSEA